MYCYASPGTLWNGVEHVLALRRDDSIRYHTTAWQQRQRPLYYSDTVLLCVSVREMQR